MPQQVDHGDSTTPDAPASSARSGSKASTKGKAWSGSTRYGGKEALPPWLAADGVTIIWSPVRIAVAKVVMSQFFERIMGCVIVFNLGLIWYETDMEAACYPRYSKTDIENCSTAGGNTLWVKIVNTTLLVVYTLELSVRLYVEHLSYFKTGWNKLDFFVVMTGWFGEIFRGMVNVAFLRIFRVSRLSRVVRIILAIKELYMLVMGMVSAMKAIFWGALMIVFLLAFFSILLVEFVHPINSKLTYDGCERCPRAYASVVSSSLTLFQYIVAGDSWGATSVPAMEADPTLISAVLMGTVLVVISLGFMNLILAVIVASAEEGRENDHKKRLEDAAKEKASQASELHKLCVQIDADGSGTIALQEMHDAYDTVEKFRSMFELIDIRREDIGPIFSMIDKQDVGEVTFDDFCENVYRLKTDDVRKLVTEARFMANDTNRLQRTNLEHLEAHAKLLETHAQMLQSINKKLDRLCGGPATATKDNESPLSYHARMLAKDPSASCASAFRCPTDGEAAAAPPVKGTAGDKVLHEAIVNVAQISSWLHEGVAGPIEDAAASLLKHAEAMVASCGLPKTSLPLVRVREAQAKIARADHGGSVPSRRVSPQAATASPVAGSEDLSSAWRRQANRDGGRNGAGESCTSAVNVLQACRAPGREEEIRPVERKM